MKRLRVLGLLLLAFMLSIVVAACGETPVTGISLNKPSIMIEVGAEEKLVASVQPESVAGTASLAWTVTDAQPAGCITVEQDGTVKAAAAGTAKVTVSSGDFSATCEVTALPKVESVTLNKTSLSLEIGKDETLSATVLPENAFSKKVAWTVDDANPAGCVTVENGKVTAVAVGTATVKATVGSKSDECTVTVTRPPVASISIAPGAMSIPVNGTPLPLSITILPENASQAITWSVASATPENCITIDPASGVISAVAEGFATIKAASVDFPAKFGTCEITVIPEGSRILIPVSSPTDFMATRFAFDADYYLTQDIDFQGSGVKMHKPLDIVPEKDYGTVGNGTWYLPENGTPYKTATLNGTFDGRGFALKNFSVTGVEGDYYFGTNEWGGIADFEESIFGNIGATGVIKNIGFVNGTVSTIGQNAIVASKNSGRIENIYIDNVSMTVTNNFGDNNCAGGVVVWQNLASGIIRNVVIKSIDASNSSNTNGNFALALVNNATNNPAQVQNIFAANDGLGHKNVWVSSAIGGKDLTEEDNNAFLFPSANIGSVDFSALPDQFWNLDGSWPVLKHLGAPLLVLGSGNGTGYNINASIADAGSEYSFSVRVLKSHAGTPAITYSVMDGVSNQALSPNAGEVENADGSVDYTFTIPASHITNTIMLGAVTGLSPKTSYTVTDSITHATGFSWSPALEAAAYEGVDYTFTLRIANANKVAGNIPKITYTVGGGNPVTMGHTSVSGSSNLNYVFTIPGEDVTGAIVLTACDYVAAQTYTITNNITLPDADVTWTATPGATILEGDDLVITIRITAAYEADKEPVFDITIGTAAPETLSCTSVNVGGSDNRRDYTFRIPSTQIDGNITLDNFQLVSADV